mgnify:FL=1
MEKRYSLKETCEAINKAQKLDRVRTLLKNVYRYTVPCWNPMLPGMFMTSQDRIRQACAQYTSLVTAFEEYKKKVVDEFSK